MFMKMCLSVGLISLFGFNRFGGLQDDPAQINLDSLETMCINCLDLFMFLGCGEVG